jgi:hypothetical protein
MLSVATYDSVPKLLDATRERGCAGSLSGDHSAVFGGEDGGTAAVLYPVPHVWRSMLRVPVVFIATPFPNEIAGP